MADKGLFCGINQPADPDNLSEMEQKHIPMIDCPDNVKAGEPFKVNINVGSIPHVMDQEHHIQWLEVSFGHNFQERIELTPVFTRPEVTITLVKGGKHAEGTLRVVERCNMHGLWEATKDISVSE